MPKAQKKARSPKSRATPLPTRITSTSKQPPASKKTSKSTTTAENDEHRVNAAQQSEASATNYECASADPESVNNYLILATLSDTANPTINRLLSLPPSFTFDKVHHVLQIAFGWSDNHLHQFKVSIVEEKYAKHGLMGPDSCLSIHVDLDDLMEEPREDDKAEIDVTLADVYEKPEWKDRVAIEYEYDLGDGWEHRLSLLGRANPGMNAQFGAPSDVKVICLAGQGHPAAEDAGGTCGWERLKDAFKHPGKAESREKIAWYMNVCLNGGKSLDPYAFDLLDVNSGLEDAFPRDGQWRRKPDDVCAGCGNDFLFGMQHMFNSKCILCQKKGPEPF